MTPERLPGLVAFELSAIDAFVGGLATAFFAGLLASGAYLLKQLLALKEQVATIAGRLDEGIEEALGLAGGQVVASKTLRPPSGKKGR